jgi:hypothetical protein
MVTKPAVPPNRSRRPEDTRLEASWEVGSLGDQTLPGGLEALARQRESKEVVGMSLRRRPKFYEA